MGAWSNGERELRLLANFVDPSRVALDIGAAEGVYSWHLMRLVSKVIAFEPNPHLFKKLRKAAPFLEIYPMALSNRRGTATLRVPVCRNTVACGWGTIHPGNEFEEISPEEVRELDVRVVPLDELGIQNAGFLKIDVEGHELEVLKGAVTLIQNQRPSILVEVSGLTRGNNPQTLFALLRDLGYIALHLRDGVSIECLERVPYDMAAINIFAIPRGSPALELVS
jgi:FkbM family methyltransferase